MTTKSKDIVVWFVDIDGEQWAINAKLKQLSDWVESERPFGSKYNTVIVPSKENKFCILKSEDDVRKDFQGNMEEWLYNVRGMLKNCPTVSL